MSLHQAANNLIVLAREEAGAARIIENGGIQKLSFLLDTEKDKSLLLTSIRVLACLSHNNKERVSLSHNNKERVSLSHNNKERVSLSHNNKERVSLSHNSKERVNNKIGLSISKQKLIL